MLDSALEIYPNIFPSFFLVVQTTKICIGNAKGPVH